MRALVALLFIVGCGDSSYNCDNDEDTIFAMKLKYDEMYNKFDPRLDKILDDYLSLIEINSRELISIDDKAKRSICTAKYRIRNPKNEKDMARFLLVIEKSLKQTEYFYL